MAEKLIPYNPAKGCKLPKGEHIEMKTLPLDKIAAFFAEAKKSGVYEMYLLEIATGLRRGELLGLKGIDVDYNEGTIHVRRQICRIDGTVTEGPLKTKNSYRKIVVPADVMDVLKKKQAKDDGASEYVFFSPLTNGPISPDSVLHMLHRVLDRAGLPRIRFHDLAVYLLFSVACFLTVHEHSPRASRWIPTPTSPPACNRTQRIRWETS